MWTIFRRPTCFNKSDKGSLVCVKSPHKPRDAVIEVLEDPDEGNKPKGPLLEALEDPGVGSRPRVPKIEALEDPY